MRALAVPFLISLALPGAALASGPGPSLLADGNFDGTDPGNWALVGAVNGNSFGWFDDDSDACDESGSVELINGSGDEDFSYAEALSECIPYNAVGATLRLTVDVRIEASLNGLDGGFVALAFYTSADCAEPYASAPQAGLLGAPGDWFPLYKIAVVPAGTQSVRIRLQTLKAEAEQAAAVQVVFDRAYLGADTWVFDDSFEFGGACRWSDEVP